MKCNNCGSENAADRNFCTSCGNDLNAQANSEAVLADTGDSAENAVFAKMPEKFTQNESVYQTLDDAQPLQNGTNVDADTATFPENNVVFSKPKKRIMPTVLIILAALVLVGGLFVGLNFQKIKRAIVGQEKYYIMQEKALITESTEDFVAMYQKSLKTPMQVKGTMKITDMSALEALGLDAATVSLFKGIAMDVQSDMDMSKGLNYSTVDVKADGTSLMQVIMQEKDDKMAMSTIADPSKQMVTMSTRFLTGLLAGDEAEIKKATGMSKKELTKVVDRYFENVIINSFGKDNVKKGSAEFNGKKCDTTQFILNAKVEKAMALALAKEIKSDKELEKIVIAAATYTKEKSKAFAEINGNIAEEITIPTASEVKEMLEEVAKSLEETADAIDEQDIVVSSTYTVFYDKAGKIQSRQLEASGETLSLNTYEKSGKNVTEFILDEGETKISIVNSATNSKEVYEGDLALAQNDEKIMTVTYDYKKNQNIGGVDMMTGDMKVTIGSGAASIGSLEVKTEKKGNDGLLASINGTVSGAAMGISTGDLKVGMEFDAKYSNKPTFDKINIIEKSNITEEELTSLMFAEFYNLMGIDPNAMGVIGGADGETEITVEEEEEPAFPSTSEEVVKLLSGIIADTIDEKIQIDKVEPKLEDILVEIGYDEEMFGEVEVKYIGEGLDKRVASVVITKDGEVVSEWVK